MSIYSSGCTSESTNNPKLLHTYASEAAASQNGVCDSSVLALIAQMKEATALLVPALACLPVLCEGVAAQRDALLRIDNCTAASVALLREMPPGDHGRIGAPRCLSQAREEPAPEVTSGFAAKAAYMQAAGMVSACHVALPGTAAFLLPSSAGCPTTSTSSASK